jgi:GTP cyclohydrolase I
MVVVRDIEFYSLCEHHLLPFSGRAHVAYIPDGKIIGLSKIPRLVEMFARRLQVQERMTRQIADTLQAVLNPSGVAVVVEGAHMCAMMRGVRKADASMVTRAVTGVFEQDEKLRREFLDHLRRKES